MEKRDVISLGLGVQSCALYFMSSLGKLPRAETAIFIDLGSEGRKTYEYLNFLMDWQKKNDGIPIQVVRKKNLLQDLLNHQNSSGQSFVPIPAYTKGDNGKASMIRRQCTNEYKIKQVDEQIREWLQVENLRGQHIRIWKGISADEWDRMNNPEQLWKVHVYPFTGYEVRRDESSRIPDSFPACTMTRIEIVAWYKRQRLPVPPKSSCFHCPLRSELSWAKMKIEEPQDFESACQVDEALRDGTKKGSSQPAYLHESLKPLRSIQFSKDASDLWAGECSGECHV